MWCTEILSLHRINQGCGVRNRKKTDMAKLSQRGTERDLVSPERTEKKLKATFWLINSWTAGNAPFFHAHISRSADAALTVPAESSTSSVQHERQSFTRLGSLTISSNLLHFEQTSVSVKPSSRHPVVAGAACTTAANRSRSADSRA